jgi:hypothetical protein
MLAVPVRSPLALTAVPVSKLQGRPLIAPPRPGEEPVSSAVAALHRRHQVSMPVVGGVETVHSAISLVLAGEGLAILPACVELGSPRGANRPRPLLGRSPRPNSLPRRAMRPAGQPRILHQAYREPATLNGLRIHRSARA